VNRVLRAAILAGAGSGVPSTAWALARGDDVLAPTWAAGGLLIPGGRPGPRLLAAAALAHGALTLGWTAVLDRALPRRNAVPAGAAAGLAIAAVDLGFARAYPDAARLRGVGQLPLLPQLADHVAFGVLAAAVLRPARRPRRSTPGCGPDGTGTSRRRRVGSTR
jgi:hypothetical protein